MESVIKLISGSVATIFVYLLGGLDIALQSLLVVIVLDYITGVSKGYVTKKLNSNKGFKGIVKKLGMLCMVALSVIVDRIMGDSGLIRTMVIYCLVANEGLSMLENLAEMDILVPEILKERLEQLRNKRGKTNE